MVDVAFDTVLARDAAPVESPARRALRRLGRRKGALVGLAVIALFVAVALLAPLISPYDPTAQGWTAESKPPSWLHWFGTDEVGRDILSRLMFGARLPARRRDLGLHRARMRRPARPHRRLPGLLRRGAGVPADLRDA